MRQLGCLLERRPVKTLNRQPPFRFRFAAQYVEFPRPL